LVFDAQEPEADAAQRPAPRLAPPAARPAVLAEVTRWFFLFGLAASAAGALLAWLTPAPRWSVEIGLGWCLLALYAALCLGVPARRLPLAMGLLMVGASALIVLSAFAFGTGLSAPGLAVFGVLTCLLCASAGARPGSALALLQTAALLAIALGEPASRASAIALVSHLLAVASGLACGLMVLRVVTRYLKNAAEREHRFRSLLALAANGYWEIDAQYRLVAGRYGGGDQRPLTPERGFGQVPWEMARFRADADTLDRLLADLDAHAPFREVPVFWTLADGSEHLFLASGEPRFDERGMFTGYWGVARDVTDQAAARAALEATELRYRELFSRIPTPLVLHRDGHPIEANLAALALFGWADERAMKGANVLETYEHDSRRRARARLAELMAQPPGSALPVTDFKLRVGARRVSVRATGVVVPAPGGPAVLSIYADDTERIAAEEAVRRSEALLSHLVATSPDLITLTELDSGRYAMVNRAFERAIGWSAAEAVGRTSLELGIWSSPAERERFVALIREQDQVADLPMRFRKRDGSVISLLVSAARFTMDRRDYLVINARDVSENERSRLEREAILANASVGIAVTREGRFVLTNRHFERVYGWGPGELHGLSGRVAWRSDEEYRHVGATYGPLLARGEAIEFEHLTPRKDGSTFLASIRARAIDPQSPATGGTVWIVEDITERRRAEQALARARDDAEAANRAKSAFLANTSHELRTPLNGIIGLAQLAREPDIGEAERRQYLDQIARSASALAGTISDILDFSKIEAGKLEIERTTFDLGELLQSLRHTYGALAAGRGLAFHYRSTLDAEGPVLGDPLRVRQIVVNFLSNAIKFTEHGEVELAAWREGSAGSGEAGGGRSSSDGSGGGAVHIEVRDSGPGIAEATLARLFSPFTQADESTTRRFGGSGLGLSIARELATLMGGEVGVDSREGAGSRFWLRLPLPRTAAAPADSAHAAGATGSAQPPSLAGLRVLVVEDNAVNMLIAAALLERWGIGVGQAVDGPSALALLDQAERDGQPYDLVLMDVQMPGMSGHEATRALRRAGRRLPVIALTAAALVSEREEALASGMNDFLTKPIDADKLRDTLLRWRS
jgi:PAS domain S-box-containing protein